jgi:5-methylthioadenosine/S-adenosylhomocysteine deaminase
MRSLEKLLDGFKGHERITPGLGPHAPFTVSDDNWKIVRELSLKHDLHISTHVSETEKEVRESFEKYGKSPVARLSSLGILELQPTMAHCVHLNEADIDLIARSGAGPVHNPHSNMQLTVGVAPVVAMLRAGVHVGIGTDGAASNNDLNIFREMDTAVKLQKLERRDSTAMTACDGLRMATWSGARALGLGDQVGSIEVGKCADIIGVSLARSNMQPVFDVVSQLVYAASGDEVEWSMCHGKMIMENAHPLHLDWPSIFADAKHWQTQLAHQVPGTF